MADKIIHVADASTSNGITTFNGCDWRDINYVPPKPKDGLTLETAYELELGVNNLKLYNKNYFPSDLATDGNVFATILHVNPIVLGWIRGDSDRKRFTVTATDPYRSYLSFRIAYFPHGDSLGVNAINMGANDKKVPSTLWSLVYPGYNYGTLINNDGWVGNYSLLGAGSTNWDLPANGSYGPNWLADPTKPYSNYILLFHFARELANVGTTLWNITVNIS